MFVFKRFYWGRYFSCHQKLLQYSKFKHANKYIFTKSSISSLTYKEEDAISPLPIKYDRNFRDNLNEKLLEAKDISSLLSAVVDVYNVNTALQALRILTEWKDEKSIDFQHVENDDNYQKFVDLIEKYANKCHSEDILKALRNLNLFQLSNQHFLVESLSNDLLWNLRKSPVASLLRVLEFHNAIPNRSERQERVIKQTLEELERRWLEIKFAKDICAIYRFSSQFSTNFIGHVDDRVMDISPSLSLPDLAQIMSSICISKRRPTPLLRSFAFHIFKKNERLSPKQVANLLFALNSLNFYEENLLSKLSSDLTSEKDQIFNLSVCRTLIQCMGQMRWRDLSVIDILSNVINFHRKQCVVNDIANLLLTLASVSYIPENIDNILKSFDDELNLSEIKDKSLCIDIVWALTLLGKVSNDHLSFILDSSFVKSIPQNDLSCIGMWLKLLNINASANVLLESYTGPVLDIPTVNNLFLTKSKLDYSLQNYVLTVLHNFLPPPKYIKENVIANMGFTIDAIFVMDKNRKPLCVSDYLEIVNGAEKWKPLPEGSYRVALMVWNFKDYTIGSRHLTGQNAFIETILRKMGFVVVGIPYFNINKREKVLRTLQYIEKEISNSIQGL